MVAVYAAVGTVIVVGIVFTIVVVIVVRRRRREDHNSRSLRKTITNVESTMPGRKSKAKKLKKGKRLSRDTLMGTLGTEDEDRFQLDLINAEISNRVDDRKKYKERERAEFQKKLHNILDQASRSVTPKHSRGKVNTHGPTHAHGHEKATHQDDHRQSLEKAAAAQEQEEKIRKLSDLESDAPLLEGPPTDCGKTMARPSEKPRRKK